MQELYNRLVKLCTPPTGSPDRSDLLAGFELRPARIARLAEYRIEDSRLLWPPGPWLGRHVRFAHPRSGHRVRGALLVAQKSASDVVGALALSYLGRSAPVELAAHGPADGWPGELLLVEAGAKGPVGVAVVWRNVALRLWTDDPSGLDLRAAAAEVDVELRGEQQHADAPALDRLRPVVLQRPHPAHETGPLTVRCAPRGWVRIPLAQGVDELDLHFETTAGGVSRAEAAEGGGHYYRAPAKTGDQRVVVRAATPALLVGKDALRVQVVSSGGTP